MDILHANLLDLKALRQLGKTCFEKDAWPLIDLIAVLSFPEVVRLKAVEAEEMIGFIAGDPRPRDGWGWIATVAVDPRFQRQGIGRTLLHACEARLGVAKARLTVRISNTVAITLYESAGYHTIDIWRAYYNDGESAQLMEKSL